MVDVYNREKGSFEDGRYDTASVLGRSLTSSIDADLQEYGEKLMQNKIGAVVAIEPATGEILAMLSSPTYDPNLLVGRLKKKNYPIMVMDTTKPLYNRATMAKYPPGSTFKLVNALIGQENIDPFAAVNRQTGSVLNQNQELLFRGVTLRSHSFSWVLTPRSKAEADEIKAIIMLFKSSMSAKKTGAVADSGKGIFIQSPDVYNLTYYSGKNPHPFLNQFKVCALTSLSADYTATGAYATYADGTPIQISLALTFQELTPIYAEDYQTTRGQTGVGY
jgi:hypothetical protein